LYTDAGKQAFLSGAYVIVVPFLTWLVSKKQPKLKTYIGSLLCFYGISLVSLNVDMSINIGDILTILSSVFFAAQIVIAGYYIEREDAAVMATVQFGVMGVLSTLVVIVIKDMSFMTVFTKVFSFSSLSVVYLGVLGTATAYYVQILCQKHTNTTTTSIILSMEAVFGALIAVLVLKDVFTIKMLFGAIVILFSILISEIDISLNKICNAIKSNIIKSFNSK
jgi:drug/metabolite transporter (DMT)-like permease